jgi:hypothetical protein
MLNNTADQLRNHLTSLVPVKVSWFGILPLRTTDLTNRAMGAGMYVHGDIAAQYTSISTASQAELAELAIESLNLRVLPAVQGFKAPLHSAGPTSTLLQPINREGAFQKFKADYRSSSPTPPLRK